jgi:hypothetical protein
MVYVLKLRKINGTYVARAAGQAGRRQSRRPVAPGWRQPRAPEPRALHVPAPLYRAAPCQAHAVVTLIDCHRL